MEYRLQNLYKHMVGRSASVVSPFYFILLDWSTVVTTSNRLAKTKMCVTFSGKELQAITKEKNIRNPPPLHHHQPQTSSRNSMP